MFKRLSVLVLLVTLCAALLPSHPVQAGGDWYAYVYNSETFELVRVHLSGQQDTVDLGIPAGYRPMQLAFSAYGEKVAYCAISDSDMQNNLQRQHLIVRSIMFDGTAEVDTTLWDFDLGYVAGCVATFSDDANQLAISIVNYYMGDPAADMTQPSWKLSVYDLATGTVAAEIDANTNPNLVTDPMFAGGAVMPEVRSFISGLLIFGYVPWGIGGAIEVPAFAWTLSDNSIAPVDVWGKMGVRSYPGVPEMVYAEWDQNLPAGEAYGPMPTNNVVRVVGQDGTLNTIFYDPTWLIVDMQYINDGQQLAIMLTAQDTTSADMVVNNRWIALDRTGQTTDLVQTTDWVTLRDAPVGYVLFTPTLTDPNDFASRIFTFAYYSGGVETPLWTSPLPGQYWDLVWAMQLPAAEPPAAFTPIQP
jgi:hypothetical protein